MIVNARERSGLSLRTAAELAGTSHATLSAYEHGYKTPTIETLDRILQALGATVTVVTGPRRFSGTERAKELREVLRLAEIFPARHGEYLVAPPIATARRA